MSILEVQQKIIEFLLNNDSIKYEQFNQFLNTTDDKDAGIAAILGGLQQLEKADILYSYQPNPSDMKTLVYVKTRPLELNIQNLPISGALACAIANAVSNFADAVGSKELKANALAIKEGDILVLLDIISYLSDNGDEEENKDIQGGIPQVDTQKKKK